MNISDNILSWLLSGDPAIRWQTLRDLVHADSSVIEREKQKTLSKGWGARLLAHRQASGMWAGGLYTPKWTSTTYTLLLLRSIGLPAGDPRIIKSCMLLLDNGLYKDGGINLFFSMKCSETCVTGMILAILSYFQINDKRLETLVRYLFKEQMPDGGWNCRAYRGATHSSFHTTISVLEGLRDYEKLQRPLSQRTKKYQQRAIEFLLQHRLFRSHRTSRIIDSKIVRFSFPTRWHYDVLRALDFFQECKVKHDNRLQDAIKLLQKKRTEDRRWLLQGVHSGKTFFEMEKPGQPSRWNSLRALRVLQWYKGENND
ncbi:MAG: hypothetical protein ABSB78_08430 [Bacteroidota bacterium]